MTFLEAQYFLEHSLNDIYETREAVAIAKWTMEFVTACTATERYLNNSTLLTESQREQLHCIIGELCQYKPIQYVTNEAYFFEHKLFVDERVLIPRPETECLVAWALKTIVAMKMQSETILEIGTGSGCIALALQLKYPQLAITAIDISIDALAVAAINAKKLNANITFVPFNFLEESEWEKLSMYQMIISNPPYVLQLEKKNMHNNVLQYEPHQALFVADDAPLLFYEKIARFGVQHLQENGCIMVEINSALGQETGAVFQHYGYTIHLQQDWYGMDRMLCAKK